MVDIRDSGNRVLAGGFETVEAAVGYTLERLRTDTLIYVICDNALPVATVHRGLTFYKEQARRIPITAKALVAAGWVEQVRHPDNPVATFSKTLRPSWDDDERKRDIALIVRLGDDYYKRMSGYDYAIYVRGTTLALNIDSIQRLEELYDMMVYKND